MFNALEKYATYFEMELDELLSEAESEESKGIKWKHRKNQIPTFGLQTIPLGKLYSKHCKISYD